MSTKPVILVTGATGAEGASIVKHLLKQDKFAVRALTRNPFSVSARYLAAIGASIVEGNLNDVNSLKKAMDGCYGVYGFSDFRTDAELEYDHGMNLLKAVSKSNIQHFVLSTLPNVSRISKGRSTPILHSFRSRPNDSSSSLIRSIQRVRASDMPTTKTATPS